MWGSWSFNRVAWSLRKLSLPIKSSDLVLDVGSGSNPHPAADVLLERFLDPVHRYSPMVLDRPTVIANACQMPFRDKAFDYALAFHVLEHLSDPCAFLSELQRVSRAGYIETPNAFFERIVPYDVHLLEVMNVDEVLVIHKKCAAHPDEFLNELRILDHSRRWNRFFYNNPQLFHVRYHWQEQINFTVVNPDTSLKWFQDPEEVPLNNGEISTELPSNGVRSIGLSLMRKYYKIRKRKNINLSDILACPRCHHTLLETPGQWICKSCEIAYPNHLAPDFTHGVSVAGREA